MASDLAQYKPLFQHFVPLNALSGEQLDNVISNITVDRIKNGELLFHEGDNDRRHIFLIQGQVSILSGNREIDLIKSGTQSARFALAHQLPRKFSGKAIGDVTFAHINSDLLHDLVVTSTHAQTENAEDINLDWMNLVLRARVLQQVPPANIQLVLRRMEEFPVKKGDVVIRQGDEADYFYVIARGTGIVTCKDPGGDRQLAVLAQGDSFGEDSLVSGGIRTATVSMASNGILMRLRKEDFIDLIRKPLVQGFRMDKARRLIKDGATWLDIRPAEEYAAHHMPNAINLPLENLRERYGTYSKSNKYITYGPAGESAVGTFLLRERGFDVVMLDGWVPEQEGPAQDSGLNTATSVPASASTSESTTVSPATQQRTQDLEKQLAVFQKMLRLQLTDIQQLKQKVESLTAENERLEQSLRVASESGGDGNHYEEVAVPLKQRIVELEQDVNRLNAELEEAQEILQDAAGMESKMNWGRREIQTKLEQAERNLAGQSEINRMLREENEQLKQQLKEATKIA